MLLEPIYEADFLPCSHGFRRGRSAHVALAQLYRCLGRQGQTWVIDADLAGYFDSIPHGQLRDLLDLRIKDGVVRRMIDKWLCAGVLENGTLHKTDTGTPQGGVISPLLANLFLHYVLDRWFAGTVQPRLRGGSQLVRFADDCAPRRRARRAAALRAAVLRKRWRQTLRSRRAGGGCKPPTAAAFKRRGGERVRKRQGSDLVRYGSWSRTQVNR